MHLAGEVSICFGKFRVSVLRFHVEVDGTEAYLLRKRGEDHWRRKDEKYWSRQSEELDADNKTQSWQDSLWGSNIVSKTRREDPQVLEGWWDYTCKHNLRHRGSNASGMNKLSDSNIVGYFSNYECQDPRDRVYIALALAD